MKCVSNSICTSTTEQPADWDVSADGAYEPLHFAVDNSTGAFSSWWNVSPEDIALLSAGFHCLQIDIDPDAAYCVTANIVPVVPDNDHG